MRLLYHVWNALGALEAYQYLISAGIDVSYFIYQVDCTEERKDSRGAHYKMLTSELKKSRMMLFLAGIIIQWMRWYAMRTTVLTLHGCMIVLLRLLCPEQLPERTGRIL